MDLSWTLSFFISATAKEGIRGGMIWLFPKPSRC